MGTRDKMIDIAKGIGIISVVWGHLVLFCPVKTEIFLFHMPLFFLLSGYFFHDNQLRFIEMLKKNARSYLIPYITFFVVCLSIFIALYLLTGRVSQIRMGPKILIHPYGVVITLWFLLSLFEVHTIYYLIDRLKKGSAKFLCIVACTLVGYLLFRKSIELPLFIGSSLSMVVFFYIGNLLKKKEAFRQPEKIQLTVCGIGIALYCVGIYFNLKIDIMKNILGDNVLLFILSATGASYAIIYISKWLAKTKYISAALSYIGQNTLVVFALHMVCFEIARCLFLFPFLEKSPLLEGGYMLLWGIAGSLLIGMPIKKHLLPYITKRLAN